MKEEFEPYFSDNCCFFGKPKKAYLAKNNLFGPPKKPLKESISPKKNLKFTSLPMEQMALN